MNLLDAQTSDLSATYQFTARLGVGGSGAVFAATRRTDDASVAVKIFHDEATPAQLDDLRLRARSLMRLHHPGCVRVLAVDTAGTPHVVLERVVGETFAQWLRGQPDPREVIDAIARIAEALEVLHGAGSVHGDLSATNVLMSAEGPVVIDYNLLPPRPSAVTRTGGPELEGTPTAMAPEQIRGLPVDPRADVYALGLLLYQGLAGRNPFARPTVAATLLAHLTAEPPLLSSVVPTSPPFLDAVIQRALAKRPQDRFRSMRALHRCLQDARRLLDDPTFSPRPLPPVTQARRWDGLGAWSAAAMMLVGFGIVVSRGVTGLHASLEPTVAPPVSTLEVVDTVEMVGPERRIAVVAPPAVAPVATTARPSRRPAAPVEPPVALSDQAPDPPLDQPLTGRKSDLRNPFVL